MDIPGTVAGSEGVVIPTDNFQPLCVTSRLLSASNNSSNMPTKKLILKRNKLDALKVFLAREGPKIRGIILICYFFQTLTPFYFSSQPRTVE